MSFAWQEIINLLIQQPLLLLFVIIIVGYPIGKINFGGFSLGVAAILFSGLAIGSLHPDLKLPEFVYLFGLVLFVYTIGISTGETFFSSFRKNGLKENLLALSVIFGAFLFFIFLDKQTDIKSTLLAGMFAGSLTNTPALAQLLDYLKMITSVDYGHNALSEPVIAYSICYPLGVLAMILAILLCQKIWKINYQNEYNENTTLEHSKVLLNVSIEVTGENNWVKANDLIKINNWNVAFGRLLRDGKYQIVQPTTSIMKGDIISVVGAKEELEEVISLLGKKSDWNIANDHTQLDFRRVFVSNPEVIGKKIGELRLLYSMGATITRIRRGDVDIVPTADTLLLPGDRVRVLCNPTDMAKVSKYIGDSYKEISEIDVLTFSLGIGLGLLVGMIPIYQSNTMTIKLGVAGGPLLVSLILGYFGRTGKINWSLPYSANLTLRQIGILLFLAGVGSKAGYTFYDTFVHGGSGWILFGIGGMVTFVSAIVFLFVGYKIMKIPMGRLVGMLAGMQTQPALLSFANEQAKNELPNSGYASVYPLSTILKIVLAQILLTMVI
ncbi:MAG: TrkA C-terminal domain-containing protein [Bacteroidota bacterium]|nr:TrkA C-terminal domain-containing protein [Bacteroidota bacterium]